MVEMRTVDETNHAPVPHPNKISVRLNDELILVRGRTNVQYSFIEPFLWDEDRINYVLARIESIKRDGKC
jgi:hypothetical protein